jgi:hypothetical protein
VRADQVLATAQAFEKIIERDDGDGNRQRPADQPPR